MSTFTNKNITKGILILICLYLIWSLFIAIKIYTFSKNYSDEKADAAIVLGAAVWDSIPSPVYKERLNHAIHLYKNKKVGYIIFTGGIGTKQKYSEGEIGKQYALQAGISSNAMYYDSTSTITYENLENTKQLMLKLNIKSVLLVSDPLHMKRAIGICKKLEINALPSPTQTSMYKSNFSKLKSLTYETFFFSVDLTMNHLAL